MSSMWSQMSGLPGIAPQAPNTGGVTPLPPRTGGVYPKPVVGPGDTSPGGPTLPGTGGGDPPIYRPPNTGGVYPKPVVGPGDTHGQGIDESAPIGTPPPNTEDITPLSDLQPWTPPPPNRGGVYPRPITDAIHHPPNTGGVYPRPITGGGDPYTPVNPPRGRQPEWVQRPQPSFRRPNFWQAVRQMAQPSVSNSAANQARAQQQQSNAARARAAFLSGFYNVRRPMNQYREREQVAAPYAGGIDRGNGLYSPGMRPQTGGGDPYNRNPHGGPSEFTATHHQYGGGQGTGEYTGPMGAIGNDYRKPSIFG